MISDAVNNAVETVGKSGRNTVSSPLNRRSFIAALGIAGASGTTLLSGCTASNTVTPITNAGPQQSDILNFALNLEYLEATFYSYITQGTDLPSSATGGSGAITGAPAKLVFTGSNAQQITDMLNEIYFDELNHVLTLRSLLGSALVSRPAINLSALGSITATNALSIARLFEDVGVTAYAGAAGSLTSGNLGFAAQILGVESFHAGALRLISMQNAAIAAYDQADALDVAPYDPNSATVAAAGPTTSGAFFATAGASSATSSTPQGFAFSRTTSQVLAIAYASAAPGTSSGGFFPNGFNGAIRSV